MKRLLVTGGSGDLGGALCETALANGWEVHATFLSHPERIRAGYAHYCNLTNPLNVRQVIGDAQPDVIIHTAITEASTGYESAIGTAAELLWRYSPAAARLILLSSDMVFDGRNAPYSENAPTSPLSPYGRAKARMEKSAPAAIVRTSLIYDFDTRNKQVAWMLAKLRKGERLKLFYDEFRSPIWAVDLSDALLTLADQDVTGMLNVAGPERMSRLELGRNLLNALGYNADTYIDAASQVGTGRAPDLTLDISRAKMVLGRSTLTFKQAFEAHKKRGIAAVLANGTAQAAL
jgi:dTDP-4-dehydrorhamnose reductase